MPAAGRDSGMAGKASKALLGVAVWAAVLVCGAAAADPFRGAGGGLRAAARAASNSGPDDASIASVRVLTTRDGNWQQQLRVQERQRTLDEAGVDMIASMRQADQENLAEERERLADKQQLHRERMQMQQRQEQQSEALASAPAADPTLVADIQRALTDLGYWPGPIDGRLGTQTVIAIENYQTARGLLVTGQPSQALLQHMRGR